MSAPGNPLETYDVPSRRRWTVLSSICPTGNPGGAALAGARASAITIRSQRSLALRNLAGGSQRVLRGGNSSPCTYSTSRHSKAGQHIIQEKLAAACKGQSG